MTNLAASLRSCQPLFVGLRAKLVLAKRPAVWTFDPGPCRDSRARLGFQPHIVLVVVLVVEL
jgi:hypothetical protein